MIVILIIFTVTTVTNSLHPAQNEEPIDNKTRDMLSKYIDQIPDIKDRYVVDERLSRVISHYFKGKISTFPLYKVSLKIGRDPIRIPWTMEKVNENTQNKTSKVHKTHKRVKKQYKIIAHDDFTSTTQSRVAT